jgi:hypothetical protein
MSALKPQGAGAVNTPVTAEIRWPTLVLPEEHPVFGMPPGSKETIEQWYSSVQGAINTHNQAVAAQLDSLQKQLKSTGK